MFSQTEKAILVGSCVYGLGMSIWILNQARTDNDGNESSKMTKIVFGILPILYIVVCAITLLTKSATTRNFATQMSARKMPRTFGTQMSRPTTGSSYESYDRELDDLLSQMPSKGN